MNLKYMNPFNKLQKAGRKEVVIERASVRHLKIGLIVNHKKKKVVLIQMNSNEFLVKELVATVALPYLY